MNKTRIGPEGRTRWRSTSESFPTELADPVVCRPHQFLIERVETTPHDIDVESLTGAAQRRIAETALHLAITDHSAQRRSQRIDVVRGNEHATRTVFDQVGDATDRAGDH